MQELNGVTLGLIQDLRDLRSGKITNADARTRAQLAREILRAVHYHMQGIAMIETRNQKGLPDARKEADADTADGTDGTGSGAD